MKDKHWNVVGPVTVKAVNGSSAVYSTLEEAVADFPRHLIDRLSHGIIGYDFSLWEPGKARRIGTWKESLWNGRGVINGDSHVFIDELGFVIPVWKVKEVAAYAGRDRASHRWNRRHVFRRGPVEGIGHRRWHWGHNNRYIGWARADEAYESELADLREDGLTVYRLHGESHWSRNPWNDERPRSDHKVRSWKKNRMTQYK